MDYLSWLRHGIQIARIERKRSRRQLGHSLLFRAGTAVVLIAIAVGSGFGAYAFGTAVQRGQIPMSLPLIRMATAVGFLAVLVTTVQRTSRLRERINTNHLLTSVSASEVIFGMILAIISRIAFLSSSVVAGISVGFALGIGSLAGILTILVAVAGLVVFTVTFGVGISFLIQLIATRSPRFRRYKTVLGLAASFVLFAGYNIAIENAISIDFVLTGLTVVPTAWFVDLGLLGVSGIQSSVLRSVSALGIVVGGIPVLVAVATVLASRVWETEPVSATMIYRSHSLVDKGAVERLFAGRVSRPVLTIARKRWLQERRIPLGFLMTGTVWILFMAVIIPAGVADEIPGLSLIVLVYIFGTGAGLGFGLMVVSTEYSSLPMTLTSVSGEQFIRGQLLAGTVVSVPATTVVTALLAAMSSVGLFEALLFVVADIALCTSGVALALAIGMRVSSRNLVPFPIPFVNTIGYDEYGHATLIRAGQLLGILGFVCLPAFGGYLLSFLEIGVAVFGIPLAPVRIWLLLLTITATICVFPFAYRCAVRLYDSYEVL